MAKLQLYWLGPPTIEYNGHPLRLEMRKTLALLAYLSLSPQNPTRETLATLFWPEYDQQHALANLRRSLSSLARSLPSGLLEANRETIGLRRVDWLEVDVDEFHQQLAFTSQHSHPTNAVCPECVTHLEQAVAIYRANFFQGFNLKDCPEFDEWQYFQQDSLRSEHVDALKKLTIYYQGQCQWEKAIRYVQSWLALDRLNEPAQRMLIKLYHQSGQRSMALRQYEILIELLQHELSQTPEPETISLYQSLLEESSIEENASGLSRSTSRGSEPLIKTKLFIPPLRMERVIRPRLLELLDAGSQRSLTLVSAPAGFGKTTLLTSWTTHTSLPIAWFSIDEGDNDPVRFLTYLIAAVDSVLESDLSEEFQTFTQSLHPSIQAALIQLINHLTTQREPVVLILDDYQFIHSPEVHKVLVFLLEKIPACMHLVIATRTDPPISLALLRARDQLVEIRMSDLRFSTEESNGFLKQVMSLHLSSEDVSALEARTEGWIAGLQMAALAIRAIASQPTREVNTMGSGQVVSRFIKAFSGSNRYIMDYLSAEVLSRRSEEIRCFLLQTSILERFSGPLCDAVTKTEGSQRILEELEKENLFLVALDNQRHWYRYHHLFAELLHFRLEETFLKKAESISVKEVLSSLEELHLRAAAWLEKNKLYGEAIHHFIAAKQYNEAAALIETQIYPMLFTTGQVYTMLEWFAGLPADLFESRPRLNIAKAWTLISPNQFDAAMKQLETAWQMLQGRQDAEASDLIGEIALLRGVLAEMSSRDVAVMRKEALLAWEKLSEADLMLRCLAAWLLGVSYRYDGDTHNAEKYLLQAVPLGREAGNLYFTLVSIVDLSMVLLEQGRSREAYQLLLQTQQEMLATNRQSHPRLGHLYINSSKILLQSNRLEEAEKHLSLGINLAAHDIANEVLFFGISTMPYLRLAQGKREEAIQLAQECLERVETYPLPYLPPIIRSNLIPFWIRVDDQDQIEEWLAECQLKPVEPISYLNESIYTSLAKVLIWQGRPQEALKILTELHVYAECRGRNGKLFYVMALQALAYKQAKDLDMALETLKGSLRLAKSEDYIRSFVDEGKPMEELLQLGVNRGLWKRAGLGLYVNSLLKSFQQEV